MKLFNNIIANIVLWALKKDLEDEARLKITRAIVKNVRGIPIDEIIDFDMHGTLLVNGKKLEPEKSMMLRESLVALKDNQARKLIRDQIKRRASIEGLASDTTQQMIFSRAALWYLMKEEELLEKMDGNSHL